MTPLIELRGIRKTYSDGHEALRGIDLTLGEGMFGLLGPNGAGKTTLLSILVLASSRPRERCTSMGSMQRAAGRGRRSGGRSDICRRTFSLFAISLAPSTSSTARGCAGLR